MNSTLDDKRTLEKVFKTWPEKAISTKTSLSEILRKPIIKIDEIGLQ